jgi:hypothetical protein
MQSICRCAVIIAAAFFCVTMILATPTASPAADRETSRVQTVAKTLHDQLKITAAQEEQWGKVVQAMQENATTMEALVKARKEKLKTMNAIDDLKSYGEITEAQATGIKNFLAAFEPLYSGMPDDQKKVADKVLTERLQKHLKKKK